VLQEFQRETAYVEAPQLVEEEEAPKKKKRARGRKSDLKSHDGEAFFCWPRVYTVLRA